MPLGWLASLILIGGNGGMMNVSGQIDGLLIILIVLFYSDVDTEKIVCVNDAIKSP